MVTDLFLSKFSTYSTVGTVKAMTPILALFWWIQLKVPFLFKGFQIHNTFPPILPLSTALPTHISLFDPYEAAKKFI